MVFFTDSRSCWKSALLSLVSEREKPPLDSLRARTVPLPFQLFRSLLRVSGYGIFVFVVKLDAKELFNLVGRPHFDRIPGHSLANVDTNLAANTFVKANLYIGE